MNDVTKHPTITAGMHPIDVGNELVRDGDFAGARMILDTLRQETPNNAAVMFNTGWFLCMDGKWQEAAQHLDAGRWLNAYGCPPLNNGQNIWRGNEQDPVAGRVVHLRSEGGFGDEMINVRWASHLAALGATVVVSCSPGLCPIFQRVAGVAACVAFEGAKYVHADWWLPAMSAMNYFTPVGTGKPYLSANKVRIKKMSNIVRDNSKPRIGLRWGGNPQFEHEQRRRFPTNYIVSLIKNFPEFQFYSFQRDNDLIDLPEDAIDLAPFLSDWEDTCAALSMMDMVVSSCTSVAHMAAALGIDTRVVAPMPAYYCWAELGNKSVWYDSATVYRQQRRDLWNDPFIELNEDLCALRNVRRIRHVG